MDCPECGLNLALVGRRHECLRSRVDVSFASGVGTETNEISETNKDVARSLRWRGRNPEKYRAYQRAYMAARRERQKALI